MKRLIARSERSRSLAGHLGQRLDPPVTGDSPDVVDAIVAAAGGNG
ncbi:MAG: hypothetical protein GXX79_11240 [Actinomycetales bacterium]|nr:hypothetical protein [Actinomycetales bacterium]